MTLIALLAVVLPTLQTETAQTATMQSDVDRLVRAAELYQLEPGGSVAPVG
jgi:hypothetical protein